MSTLPSIGHLRAKLDVVSGYWSLGERSAGTILVLVWSCRLIHGTEEALRAHEDAFLPAPVKRDSLGCVLSVSAWRERISWAVPRSSAMSESADAHGSRVSHCGGLCVPESVGEQHEASRERVGAV